MIYAGVPSFCRLALKDGSCSSPSTWIVGGLRNWTHMRGDYGAWHMGHMGVLSRLTNSTEHPSTYQDNLQVYFKYMIRYRRGSSHSSCLNSCLPSARFPMN